MLAFQFDVSRAARALRALLRDPDDLPQVFTLIESLSGTAPHRLVAAFERTASGRRLLCDKPDIVPLLAERRALAALPEGSLGRAYLAFVESENISTEGIRCASQQGRSRRPRDPRIEYVANRMRDTHDIWHALTGYRGDVIGEIALLAFSVGQHWNSGVALMVLAGIFKGIGRVDLGLVMGGFRRGRRAAWFPSQEWELLLARPLAEVREMLRVEPAPPYEPLRTADLRAMGLV
jgi:ubiquinone biosynthesis protein COQ4